MLSEATTTTKYRIACITRDRAKLNDPVERNEEIEHLKLQINSGRITFDCFHVSLAPVKVNYRLTEAPSGVTRFFLSS